MKKIFYLLVFLTSSFIFAQSGGDISSSNSWLKAGIEAGIPVGDVSDSHAFTLGIDFRGQYLVTSKFAIGLKTGYTHFFPKDNFESFGLVPVAFFARYYPTSKGIFFGADLGYGFLTNLDDNLRGGLLVSPHIGWHNDDWNFYAYYTTVSTNFDANVDNVGLGIKYNIRFK